MADDEKKQTGDPNFNALYDAAKRPARDIAAEELLQTQRDHAADEIVKKFLSFPQIVQQLSNYLIAQDEFFPTPEAFKSAIGSYAKKFLVKYMREGKVFPDEGNFVENTTTEFFTRLFMVYYEKAAKKNSGESDSQ